MTLFTQAKPHSGISRDSSRTAKPVLSHGGGILVLATLPLVLWVFSNQPYSAVNAFLVLAAFLSGLTLISRSTDITISSRTAGKKLGQGRGEAMIKKEAERKSVTWFLVAGSALIGVAVTLLAGHQFSGLEVPLLLGALASVLSFVAFRHPD